MGHTTPLQCGRSLAAYVVVFCLIFLTTPVFAHQLEPGADPWLALHAFEGEDGCLAIREGQRLRAGDRILVFAAGKPARVRRVLYVLGGDSARRIFDKRGFQGVHADKELWNRIGCYWGLGVRGEPPAISIARFEADGAADAGLPLAIEGLPASARTLGGDGMPLNRRELGVLERRIWSIVPKAFSQGKLLQVGRRYVSGQDHELIELLVGKPAANTSGSGAPIDSIDICRIFLHNGRVLSVERFSRASGREEHVDLEPPQLDESNWALVSDETLGFLSLDGGVTWDRLSVDVGFEGISWTISRLAEGQRPRWNFYLYTQH